MAKFKQVKRGVIWNKITQECRKAREEARISQREVAADCGCNQSTISQWENGRMNNGYILAYYLFILNINNIELQESIDRILR